MKHDVIELPGEAENRRDRAGNRVDPSLRDMPASADRIETADPGRPAQDLARPEQYRKVRATLAVKWGKKLRKPLNRLLARFSQIATTPVLDPGEVPGIALLKDNWPAIQAEALAVLAQRDAVPAFARISPDHRRIAPTSAWKSFFLRGYGYDSPGNRAQCPQTAALIDRIPGLVVAFFSVFEPGTEVPAHRGVTKAMLNVHLGVQVPGGPEVCGIRVAGEDHGWREGELFVFDETFEHEAWNRADAPRVILFCQVLRPMRWPGRLLGRLFLAGVRRTSYVQDARRAIGA